MTTYADNTVSLVADVGGTNTRVALAGDAMLKTDTIQRFRNSEYPGLESVLNTYLSENGNPDCAGAAVAVAGPVRDGRGELTNLDWSIDTETLARVTKGENVAVLNDLQAQGHAIGRIDASNLRGVVDGQASENAASLVIGVGTGFNAAPVHDTPGGRYVPPAEAGHANMPIRTEAELRLCKYVESAHGFPAVEDVLSGRGLERIYGWAASEAGHPGEKSAADIMAACESSDDPIAEEAVRRFVRTLGTVTGNLALNHLPFGGIYLVGGVSRAMTPYYDRYGFAEAFRDKGRFSGFMRNFSVQIIEDDYAALTGLAAFMQARRA